MVKPSSARYDSFSRRLEFSWSCVELSLQTYFVCEEQGTVSLDIIRKGNLAESSYITVKVSGSFSELSRLNFNNLHPGSSPQVKEVTATAGRDYLPNPNSLIQFDPGLCSLILKNVFLNVSSAALDPLPK